MQFMRNASGLGTSARAQYRHQLPASETAAAVSSSSRMISGGQIGGDLALPSLFARGSLSSELKVMLNATLSSYLLSSGAPSCNDGPYQSQQQVGCLPSPLLLNPEGLLPKILRLPTAMMDGNAFRKQRSLSPTLNDAAEAQAGRFPRRTDSEQLLSPAEGGPLDPFPSMAPTAEHRARAAAALLAKAAEYGRRAEALKTAALRRSQGEGRFGPISICTYRQGAFELAVLKPC